MRAAAHSFLIALVIALGPLPVIAFILVLGTDRGVRNGDALSAVVGVHLVTRSLTGLIH